MKKLLLSLGAIASVAAPVAAVVACGSTEPDELAQAKTTMIENLKNFNLTPAQVSGLTAKINAMTKDTMQKVSTEVSTTTMAAGVKTQTAQTGTTPDVAKNLFANDVKAYQALNLMAWTTTAGELKLNTMTNPEWVGPTEVKQPVVKGDFVVANKADTTTKLNSLYNSVKATIVAQDDKLSMTNKHHSQDAISAIATFFNTKTKAGYADVKTALDSALASVFTSSKLAGHTPLEVTTASGGFAANGDAQLTGVDKEVFEVGLPLLLKIVKTIAAVALAS